MKKETILDKIKRLFDIKHLVYKITLPIYLWSINMKNLEQYCKEIGEMEKYSWRYDLLEKLSRPFNNKTVYQDIIKIIKNL